jgi:hypothetical protein
MVMICQDRGVGRRGDLESCLDCVRGDAMDVEGLSSEGLVELMERVGRKTYEPWMAKSKVILESNSFLMSPAGYMAELLNEKMNPLLAEGNNNNNNNHLAASPDRQSKELSAHGKTTKVRRREARVSPCHSCLFRGPSLLGLLALSPTSFFRAPSALGLLAPAPSSLIRAPSQLGSWDLVPSALFQAPSTLELLGRAPSPLWLWLLCSDVMFALSS